MFATDLLAPESVQLQGGERVLWHGRAGVAEYAFEKPASLPKWTLPEATELIVTDQRIRYAHKVSDSDVISGEVRWLWPQHLRVQPGARESGRSAAATQIQLVCGGADGSWPALVFAGGDLRTPADADKLANLLRQSIARFRIDNTAKLGLTVAQSRLLSRLLIDPEFSNFQGGPGQTVSIPGALQVSAPMTLDPALPPPAPAPFKSAEPAAELPVAGSLPPDQTTTRRIRVSPVPREPRVVGEGATRVISVRPGIAADMARALQAAKAEANIQESEPALASRAADLAARVADLVAETALADEPTVDLVETGEDPTTNLSFVRAETIRRTAARFAGNAARRNLVRDLGAVSRGNRTN